MKTNRISIIVTVSALLAGCAAYRPVFDPQSIRDELKFETDLGDCQKIAETQRATVGRSALMGAVIGAGVGAGTGAAVGSITRQAGRGAGVGGVAGMIGGALAGAAGAAQVQRQVIVNCMIGRGYSPLQ